MKQIILVLLAISSISSMAQVGINTTDPKGTLDITSKNNTGLVLPRVTSVEDVTDGNGNAPVDGTTVYDLSRNTTCFYQNGDWVCIDTDASGNPILTDPTPPNYNTNTTIDYIKASNTGAYDAFGFSLALSGNGKTMAIGAPGERSNGNQGDNSMSNSGAVYVFEHTGTEWNQQAYLKASNIGQNDQFGYSVSLSADGNTLAVSADKEASNATGVNGNEADNSLNSAGAVYIFTEVSGNWTQEAYVKASNPDDLDQFGYVVSLSGDGNTLAVASSLEDSNATGINGNEADNSANASGAVYVFTKSGTNWSQQAYIKASNTNAGDRFGYKISLSSDGNTLAVGAQRESSNATGINGNEADNSAVAAGAAYVYTRTGSTWTQQAYIKASNTDTNDLFGTSLSLSGDGNTLAVSSLSEASNATGVNGDESNNSAVQAGAAYVYKRTGVTWTQDAYIKASNTESGDFFGRAVSLSTDGTMLAVGAYREASNATGMNGDESNNSANISGAVYVLRETSSGWEQQAYVKASNTGTGDYFSYQVSLSSDGGYLAVSANQEDSNATGINGDGTDNSANASGAAYVYKAE